MLTDSDSSELSSDEDSDGEIKSLTFLSYLSNHSLLTTFRRRIKEKEGGWSYGEEEGTGK